MSKIKFEVREVDAWKYDDFWEWNTSYFIGTFTTSAKNEKRAFTNFLRKHGIVFKVNRTLIDTQDGGGIYEIIDRKTKEPLYAAIFQEATP